MERTVVLVDMDCFYVQVEQRSNPSLKGKPCAVVQYKKWKGGGIIAVGYEARACGVTRNMRGDDAKAKCPEINLVRVPVVRGKADLTKYREAGAEVIEVFSKFSSCVERASVDEAYIDLTDEVEKRMEEQNISNVTPDKLQNTFIVGFDQKETPREDGLKEWLSRVVDSEETNIYNKKLAVAACIVEEMRAAVFEETGFRCSAGIAHNKVIAKLVCGFHKPNRQTVCPHDSVQQLFSTLPVGKIRHLGGKLGDSLVEQFNVEFIGDLCRFSQEDLVQSYGDKGKWLYNVCRGFDHELVSARQLAKSIGCGKNFTGKECLNTRKKVKHWISELSEEVTERLIKDRESNKRTAKSLTVSLRYIGDHAASRTCALLRYDKDKIRDDTFALLQKFNTSPPHQDCWTPAILNLGICAGKFVEEKTSDTPNIATMFANAKSATSTVTSVSSGQIPDTQEELISPAVNIINDKEKVTKSKRGSIKTFFQNNTATVNNTDCVEDDRKIEIIKKLPSTTNTVKGSGKGFFASKSKNLPYCDDRKIIKNKTLIDGSNSAIIEKRNQKCGYELKTSSDLKIHKKLAEIDRNVFENDNNNLNVCNGAKLSDSLRRTDVTSDMNCYINTSESDNNVENSNFETETKSVMTASATDNLREEMSVCDNVNVGTISDVQNGDQDGAMNFVLDETDFVKCEKCQKRIPVWEMPEHHDYHFALELQKETNISMIPRISSSSSSQSTSKRKLSPSSSNKKSKKNKTNTNTPSLLSFFDKK
ncbi:DNA polymerase eta isoform X1 [Patella vulgata]|uniref:DNA polymerase eta isoform X1 n=2 Tax=Patella vulgata TaxID=6465 RepID=UPI00217F7CD7|nr:DNA polymerase eta isoform X1 [Patella vulgata]